MSENPSIDALLARVAPHARAFLSRPGATIPLDTLHTGGASDGGARPEPGASLHELVMHGTLGTGGMSVVRLARQEPVGRDVAVKTLREEKRTPQLAWRLLQEAWVTGLLEHPNIVPLHDLRIDDGGTPLVVLKRIEGRSWAELLAEPARVEALADGVEPLVWHLRVLIAVCLAVEFAHDRGVLHRDIKPANVMIGRFGEVTLLDWGLAVCTGDDGAARLPRWSPADGVVGTPAYMAPEMLAPEQPPSAATDIYLLGACLAHALTGRPPHRGADLEEIVASIQAPFEPDAGPPALRAICAQALSPDPAGRPPSVTAFRRSLERTLEDRSFDRLVAAAAVRLDDLRAAAERGDAGEVAALLAACRFGFGEVLAQRPDHPTARAHLDAALHVAARSALDRSQPDVALGLLGEASVASPALLAEAQAAGAARARTMSRAEALVATHAPETGRQAKVLLAGAAWMATGVIPLWFLDIDTMDRMPVPVIVATMTVGIGVAVGVLARPSLVPHRAARNFVVLLALMPPAQGLAEIGLRMRGVSPDAVLSMPLLLGTVVGFMGALLLDVRLAVAAVAYATLWLVSGTSAMLPTQAVAVGNGLLGLCCAWVFLSARLRPVGDPGAEL